MVKRYNSCGCESTVACGHQDSTEGLCQKCRKIPSKCSCFNTQCNHTFIGKPSICSKCGVHNKNNYINNNKFVWKCICCEKEIAFDNLGDDETGTLPSLAGGTMNIHFGWFSKFDHLPQYLDTYADLKIQAAICDQCFEKKQHITRKVEVIESTKYKVYNR
jgi:hypothetical protein